MSSQQIKIVIAGRTYPLTVSAEERDFIEQAAQHIESQIELFQKNYAVKDKQDLLAMTALQVATQWVKQDRQIKDHNIVDRLGAIDAQLDSYLVDNQVN